jgi:excisionase family DNA binding protein
MPDEKRPETALYVRLPAPAGDKLDRASKALGISKKDLVTGLVSRYVDPDSQSGLSSLDTLSGPRRLDVDLAGPGAALGTYSFQALDPPEVMNAVQAAELLQVEESLVLELAEAGKLPGRKLGADWRFSRNALIAWLSTPEPR